MKYLVIVIVFLFLILSNGILQAQWTQTNGPTNAVVYYLTVSGSSIFAGTNNTRLFISSDKGDNWIQNSLKSAGPFYVNGINTFAAGGSGVNLSTNNGLSWTPVNNGITNYSIYAITGNGNDIVVVAPHVMGIQTGAIYHSPDNGTNWKKVHDVTAEYSLAFCSNKLFSGIWGITLSFGVDQSTDFGISWVLSGLVEYPIYDLAVNGTDIYAISDNWVFLSSNSGTDWAPINGLNNNKIHSFSFVGNNTFAAGDSGVFFSTNDDSNWIDISNGLPKVRIFSLTNDGTYIYAGTNGIGVWKRPLAELVPVELTSFWARTNNSIVNLNWNTSTETNNRGFEIQRKSAKYDFITITFINGNGTSTNTNNYSWSEKLQPGIYSYRLKQIDYNGKYEYSKEIEVTIAPNVFSLEQNYPNPFNPGTVISYSLPSASNVKLIIYNSIGQTLKILENVIKNEGNYSVNFDASNLPGGIYFYRLEAGQFSQIKKMVLIK